jgi:nucleoid-associated protein YgaU
MNDPAVKIALAISVLLGGAFIAIVFRPVFSMPAGPATDLNAPLNLQHQRQLPITAPTQAEGAVAASLVEQNFPASPAGSQGQTVLSPLGPPQPIPSLPSRYPAANSGNNARWGMPKDLMPVVARPVDRPRIHKIIDGDALSDLAARYLGGADRAMDLFDANRDVLRDPNLLPIGVELKLPARRE